MSQTYSYTKSHTNFQSYTVTTFKHSNLWHWNKWLFFLPLLVGRVDPWPRAPPVSGFGQPAPGWAQAGCYRWRCWWCRRWSSYVPRSPGTPRHARNAAAWAASGCYCSSRRGSWADAAAPWQPHSGISGCKWAISMVTELQIRDFGLLFNHFVLYSYDLSQFEYFYKVQR